jgi:hypothetical protein
VVFFCFVCFFDSGAKKRVLLGKFGRFRADFGTFLKVFRRFSRIFTYFSYFFYIFSPYYMVFSEKCERL